MNEEARVVAETLKTDALERMTELASAHRSMTLDAFRDLLVPELVAIVVKRFPDVSPEAIGAIVPACVNVVANRMSIDFDLLALRALDPEGAVDTDPQELDPDTERPE